MPDRFSSGDVVTWKSHAKGNRTRKTGTVVMAHFQSRGRNAPWAFADKHFPKHKRMFDGNNFPANAVFVEVLPPVGSKAKPKLYMPWPSTLERVNHE